MVGRDITQFAAGFRSLLVGGGEGIWNLLLPPHCVACQQPLAEAPGERRFCAACELELASFSGRCCVRCGVPVPEPHDLLQPCGHCSHSALRFDKGVAVGMYDGLLRHLVLLAKQARHELTAVALGEMLAERVLAELGPSPADLVCPVPMHWRRRMWRMSNSAAVLADRVARRMSLPLRERLLIRRRATQHQSELSATARVTNLRQAMGVRRPASVAGKSVLLVDDILTTGATCNEATRVLRAAGATKITVVVVARSFHR